MPTPAQDISILKLEGFEEVAAIKAGRPLFHFSGVHSFHFSIRREDDRGETWRDIEMVDERVKNDTKA
ncbi:hypothetical protein [Prosthecobacter sp.]|uniref:hypothetical protein n=1 Tax=Prosthecobacter sp. TaxID=1965333 RepID=UPI003784374A